MYSARGDSSHLSIVECKMVSISEDRNNSQNCWCTIHVNIGCLLYLYKQLILIGSSHLRLWKKRNKINLIFIDSTEHSFTISTLYSVQYTVAEGMIRWLLCRAACTIAYRSEPYTDLWMPFIDTNVMTLEWPKKCSKERRQFDEGL